MTDVFLIHAQPWDPDAGAVVDVYLTDSARTEVDGGNAYDPRVEVPVNFGLTVFDGAFGGAVPTLGNIAVLVGDGAYDNLMAYRWDNRAITIKKGPSGGSFTTVFTGRTGANTEWTLDRFFVPLRDLSERLRVPVEAIIGGYDRGVALTAGSDYADYAALAAATVAGGSYATCLAEGLVRVGGVPDGPLTFDVKGDDTGGTYVTTAADIIERLVTTQGDFTSGELDTTAFSQLNTDQGGTLGLLIRDGREIGAVLDEIMATVGGWWTIDADGKLTVERLALGTSTKPLTLDDLTALRREEPPGARAWATPATGGP